VGYATFTLDASPGRLVAFGADQHDIRDIQRTFELDDPGRDAATLGLHLPLMLFTHVYALNNHSMVFRVNPDHLTALSFIFFFPRDYFNNIAFFYLNFHFSRSWYSSL
jgi:hypothetical protein